MVQNWKAQRKRPIPGVLFKKKVCISMMSVGTAGLEIISDTLSKLTLLKHPLDGGALVRNTKDMGGLPEGQNMQQGRKLITLQLDPNFKKMNATATVVYYNAGKGSWSIAYNGETKGTFTKSSTESWVTATKIPLGVVSGNGKITLFS